jgi:hypothetical protein
MNALHKDLVPSDNLWGSIDASVADGVQLLPLPRCCIVSFKSIRMLLFQVSSHCRVCILCLIWVNAIAPGLFPSKLTNPSITQTAAGVRDVAADNLVPSSTIPTSRIGRGSEMAGSIIYMLSTAGGFLTGSVNVIDGGRLSQVPSMY